MEHLQRSGRVLSTESDGETILLRVSDGCFFGLGRIGSLIWTRLAQPARISELIEFVAGACGGLPESSAGEIAAFVEELRREGLLDAAAEAPPRAVEVFAGGRQEYLPPHLDRGTLRRAASGMITYYDGGPTESGNPGGLS